MYICTLHVHVCVCICMCIYVHTYYSHFGSSHRLRKLPSTQHRHSAPSRAAPPVCAMPKNKLGGNKAKRAKGGEKEKRELIFKEDGQEYGQVQRMLGNGRCEVSCFDGTKRLCHIRGKMRKKVWVNQGDIVLVSLRDFQDEKGDIIVKYMPDEARNLKTYNELPEGVRINETDMAEGEDSDDGIEFDENTGVDIDNI